MGQDVEPTDPEAEAAQGRVAVWLAPEDARWLARHLARTDETERSGRLRFRLLTALHKAGLPNDPWAEEEE